MVMRKVLNSIIVATFLVLPASHIAAQEVQKIVAIVNEEIISGFDVIQRINMTIFAAGLPSDSKTRQQLVPSTINTLIDERLKMQEAKRNNVEGSPEEINSAIEKMEKRFKIRPGFLEQALTAKKISIDAVLDQISVTIAWDKLVRKKILPRINITEAEVKSVQDKMRANKGKNEYLTSEIFLPVSTPNEEPQVRKFIQGLRAQMKKGASFSRMATQFSKGATAAKGGAVGWRMLEDMAPEVAQAIAVTKKGSATAPIRTTDGYYVVAIRNVRKILSEQASDSQMELSQIAIPVADTEKRGLKESHIKLANSLSKFVDNCSYMPTIFNQISNGQSGKMGKVSLSSLPEKYRVLVANLKSGEASAPYLDKDTYRIFIVCDRQDASMQSDSEDAIRRSIGNKRIGTRVERYLKDLRREAVIESR
ncbi:MAG: peptidylprolyl isomerase [Pseudomonas marincola]